MEITEIELKANELIKQYNPQNLSPFPFENITTNFSDLIIMYDRLPKGISGAILFKDGKYGILVNTEKPLTRQYFTVSHELGHYFLHKKYLSDIETPVFVDQDTFFDSPALFRLDQTVLNQYEKEANNFAANLIMPRDLVTNAWNTLNSVEKCAEIFNVSLTAMSIRLEKLCLVNEK